MGPCLFLLPQQINEPWVCAQDISPDPSTASGGATQREGPPSTPLDVTALSVQGTMPSTKAKDCKQAQCHPRCVSKKKACAIIRGLRVVSDFEFEFQMALMNRRLKERIETVFMMPRGKYIYLSSSLVKEVARLGGEVSTFVPDSVQRALRKKLRAKRR